MEVLKRLIVILFFLTAVFHAAHAQTVEFLPEINTHLRLKPRINLLFQAKQTRENGGPTQGEIGPSLDTYWGTGSNKKLLLLSLGYRYLPSAYSPTTHRVLMIATPKLFQKAKFVISDRNRGELNFSRGDLTWRYRNRLQIEREVTIARYHPIPYANAEVYFDSKFQKWSSTAIQVGSKFPIRKHADIELYYEHQNNTGPTPNQQVSATGLVLNLNF